MRCCCESCDTMSYSKKTKIKLLYPSCSFYPFLLVMEIFSVDGYLGNKILPLYMGVWADPIANIVRNGLRAYCRLNDRQRNVNIFRFMDPHDYPTVMKLQELC